MRQHLFTCLAVLAGHAAAPALAQGADHELLIGYAPLEAMAAAVAAASQIDVPPSPVRLAAARADEMPEPSVIIGYMTSETRAALNLPEADPASRTPADVPLIAVAPERFQDVDYTDVAVRRTLRDLDPWSYATMIDRGWLDPPESELARQLQRELARMGCYRMGIDGAWGPGSRRAAESYLGEFEGGPDWAAGLEVGTPNTELYRAILTHGDVECAAPAPAPTPVATNSGGSNTRATTPSRTPTRTTTTRTVTRPTTTTRTVTRPTTPTRSTGGGFTPGNMIGLN